MGEPTVKKSDNKSRLSLPAPANPSTKPKGRPRKSEVGLSTTKQDTWATSTSNSSTRRRLSKHRDDQSDIKSTSKEQPQVEVPSQTKSDHIQLSNPRKRKLSTLEQEINDMCDQSKAEPASTATPTSVSKVANSVGDSFTSGGLTCDVGGNFDYSNIETADSDSDEELDINFY